MEWSPSKAESETNILVNNDNHHLTPEIESLSVFLLLPKELWTRGICQFLDLQSFNCLRLTCHWFRDEIVFSHWKQNIPFGCLMDYIAACIKLNWPLNIYRIVVEETDTQSIDVIRTHFLSHPFPSSVSLQEFDLLWCTKISNQQLLNLPTSITKLNLLNCTRISNEGLQYLPLSLKYLDISYLEGITYEGLQELPTTITSLNMKKVPSLNDQGLYTLVHRLPNLQMLNLSWCSNLTDFGISNCQYLSNLRSLELECLIFSTQTLALLPSTITKLNLSRTNVTHDGLNALTCKNLEFLNVGNCGYLASSAIRVFSSFTSLQQLCLSFWHNLTVEGIYYLPSSLKILDLSSCAEFSKETLHSLQSACQSLKYLILDQCEITDSYLDKLPTTLQELSLRGCQITDLGIKHLLLLPSLKKLDIYFNIKVTPEAISLLTDRQIKVKW